MCYSNDSHFFFWFLPSQSMSTIPFALLTTILKHNRTMFPKSSLFVLFPHGIVVIGFFFICSSYHNSVWFKASSVIPKFLHNQHYSHVTAFFRLLRPTNIWNLQPSDTVGVKNKPETGIRFKIQMKKETMNNSDNNKTMTITVATTISLNFFSFTTDFSA